MARTAYYRRTRRKIFRALSRISPPLVGTGWPRPKTRAAGVPSRSCSRIGSLGGDGRQRSVCADGARSGASCVPIGLGACLAHTHFVTQTALRRYARYQAPTGPLNNVRHGPGTGNNHLAASACRCGCHSHNLDFRQRPLVLEHENIPSRNRLPWLGQMPGGLSKKCGRPPRRPWNTQERGPTKPPSVFSTGCYCAGNPGVAGSSARL